MTPEEESAVHDLDSALRRPYRQEIAGPWVVTLEHESARTLRNLIDAQTVEIEQLRQHLNPIP